MARLKSRDRFIPNGFVFYQPQTGWKAPKNRSFETIVNALIHHRKGNPHLVEKHHWATDHDTVADELDAFNAAVCERMGWKDFIQSNFTGSAPPKFFAPSPSDQSSLAAAAGRIKKIWSGIRTLSQWYDSQEPGVPAELSTARAKTCSECLMNQPGDFSTWFTGPAAEAIKRQIEKFADRKLSTPYDDKLHTCAACLCVNKLSVHAPLHLKVANLSKEVEAELRKGNPDCWVVREMAQ
jgi:hypothetical protein